MSSSPHQCFNGLQRKVVKIFKGVFMILVIVYTRGKKVIVYTRGKNTCDDPTNHLKPLNVALVREEEAFMSMAFWVSIPVC